MGQADTGTLGKLVNLVAFWFCGLVLLWLILRFTEPVLISVFSDFNSLHIPFHSSQKLNKDGCI